MTVKFPSDLDNETVDKILRYKTRYIRIRTNLMLLAAAIVLGVILFGSIICLVKA